MRFLFQIDSDSPRSIGPIALKGHKHMVARPTVIAPVTPEHIVIGSVFLGGQQRDLA